MSRGTNQKLKLLYLSKILKEQTDDTHYLTMPQIIAELDKYDISANRKSIYDDIEALNDFGMDIVKERMGAMTYYHCGNREFEIAELKFLVDAIQSSKFITVRKTRELIRKLESLVSVHDAKLLDREVYVAGRIKNMDESIYYAIDAIHTALIEGKQIRFLYFSWNLKGEKEFRHNGTEYCISPWALCWDDENYYMVGFDETAGIIKHYRVDKMTNITLTDQRRKGTEHFRAQDKAVYTKKRFRMFDGKERQVTLRCKNYLSNVIVDQFGKDVSMRPFDEEHFTVNVDVAVSKQFFGWVLALGGDAVITKPEAVKEEMKKLLEDYMKESE